MPPKRAASKRKAEPPSEPELEAASESESERDFSDAGPAAKKRKTAAKAKGGAKALATKAAKGKGPAKAKANAKDADVAPGDAADAQPTNKVLPVHISFAPKTDSEGTVRIATWNICGLAAAQKKGFKYYVEAEDADILVLTETKVNNEPADPALAQRYPHRYWAISDKKTYSGTAILSKVEPLSVDYTLPGHPAPSTVKGRIVTLEFAGCFVVGTYVVNAGTGLKTLDAKKEWNVHFEAYIRGLDAKKPVIWTGDLNVAPTALDLANPKTNWDKTPGYTEAETSAFARVLNTSGEEPGEAPTFVDVWRKLHPDVRHYTYFSYRFNCREKGLGWRLDTFVVSSRVEERVRMCEIRSEIYGASDHCPVVLELAGPL